VRGGDIPYVLKRLTKTGRPSIKTNGSSIDLVRKIEGLRERKLGGVWGSHRKKMASATLG